MKIHLSRVLALTCATLLALTASPALAAKGGKGKPGGGGEEPPPSPAPVEYQLTWVPGIDGGRVQISDCNTAGFAVGSYQDETGTYRPFCTTADGEIAPLENWWVLPPGYEDWRVGGQLAEMQINEANLVCGTIGNDQTSEYQLFLADLADPDSLEVVGPVQQHVLRWVFMNENGDVTFWELVEGNFTRLHLYVRSLDRSFSLVEGELSYYPTGINENLQISLVRKDFTGDYYLSPTYAGSALLTFDVATLNADIEPLGVYAEWREDPVLLPYGGLNNAGTVFGFFENKVNRVRVRSGRVVSRVADSTAGFIAADSDSWTELDPRLPVGGAQVNLFSYAAAACALGVNEDGQVVGGYQCQGRFASEELWLLDPEDGLFDVNDLVMGDPGEIEAFRSASGFGYVHITENGSETGYGIISGFAAGAGFILTPQLVEQP